MNEYWIVEPKKESVEIFLNVNYSFELKQKIVSNGFAKSYVIEGFEELKLDRLRTDTNYLIIKLPSYQITLS